MASRRKWWLHCFLRYFRMVALLLLVVLVVTPLRDVILSPVLPANWRSHSSLRIARVLLDNQHFPVDSVSRGVTGAASSPSLDVDLADVARFLEAGPPYEEYFKNRQGLLAAAQQDPRAARQLRLVDRFYPNMTREERAQLFFTFDVFVRACRRHGLMFFAIEGTLLGAFRHGGLIPWDDDVDVALNSSQWRLALQVLSAVPGFTLYAPSDSQWKFYLSSLPRFLDKPFKWPNIDIFFVDSDSTHVWALTWGVKHRILMEQRMLLPLTTVRWQQWDVPAPRCWRRMVRATYDVDTCATPYYVHKTNEETLWTGKVPCSKLHDLFPFVFREADGSTRKVTEVTRVGERVLRQNAAPMDEPADCLT